MKLIRLVLEFLHVPVAILAIALGFLSDILLDYLDWIERKTR